MRCDAGARKEKYLSGAGDACGDILPTNAQFCCLSIRENVLRIQYLLCTRDQFNLYICTSTIFGFASRAQSTQTSDPELL